MTDNIGVELNPKTTPQKPGEREAAMEATRIAQAVRYAEVRDVMGDATGISEPPPIGIFRANLQAAANGVAPSPSAELLTPGQALTEAEIAATREAQETQDALIELVKATPRKPLLSKIFPWKK